MLLEQVSTLVRNVQSFGANAGVGTVRKFLIFVNEFVTRMDAVISTTTTVVNTVNTWTKAENSLQDILNLMQEVVDKSGVKQLVDNVITGQTGLINFGTKVTNIAGFVTDKVTQGVSAADEYVTMAEEIVTFLDTFDSIDGLVKSVTDTLSLTSSAERNGGTCLRKDQSLPDLCVSQRTITPEISLYKKVLFPMEMMFLNMLSTRGMISSAVSKSVSNPSCFYSLKKSLCSVPLSFSKTRITT